MSTVSNVLLASAFFSGPEIRVVSSSGPLVQLKPNSSPVIQFVLHKPGKTPIPRKPDSLTIAAIPPTPERSNISGWRLKSVILVQLRRERKEWLATTWLEGVAEYGAGETDDEAIIDLVVSLGEYSESLEKREGKLGDSAQRELAYLKKLVERALAK